jgi:hypothetical protein
MLRSPYAASVARIRLPETSESCGSFALRDPRGQRPRRRGDRERGEKLASIFPHVRKARSRGASNPRGPAAFVERGARESVLERRGGILTSIFGLRREEKRCENATPDVHNLLWNNGQHSDTAAAPTETPRE